MMFDLPNWFIDGGFFLVAALVLVILTSKWWGPHVEAIYDFIEKVLSPFQWWKIPVILLTFTIDQLRPTKAAPIGLLMLAGVLILGLFSVVVIEVIGILSVALLLLYFLVVQPLFGVAKHSNELFGPRRPILPNEGSW